MIFWSGSPDLITGPRIWICIRIRLRIYDILVRIRISEPLTQGSGSILGSKSVIFWSGSADPNHWLKDLGSILGSGSGFESGFSSGLESGFGSGTRSARLISAKKILNNFVYYFGGLECWPLLRLCRPFMIFEGCLDSNPECCRSKLARYRLSHPSPA